jgi:hypothetical protein
LRFILLDQLRHSALGVIKVPEIQGAGAAGHHTKRRGIRIVPGRVAFFQAGLNARQAKIALGAGTLLPGIQSRECIGLAAGFKRMCMGVYRTRIIGAGHDAGTAPHAFVRIYDDDAILPLICGGGGADRQTGRLAALHASGCDKQALSIGRVRLAELLKVAPESLCDIICLTTGQDAGFASDTLAQVDDHYPVRHQATSRICFI